MKVRKLLKVQAVFCSALLLAGCATVELPAHPCDAADRPVSLEVLLQNSMSGAYEACLSHTRSEAAEALES